MGFSVISLIEVFYFLAVRVRHHYVHDLQRRHQRLEAATKNVQQLLQGDRLQQLPTQRMLMATRTAGGDPGGANGLGGHELGRRRW